MVNDIFNIFEKSKVELMDIDFNTIKMLHEIGEGHFYGIDSKFHLCLAIKTNRGFPQSIKTSKLDLELNYKYQIDGKTVGLYSVIKLLSSSKLEIETFVRLCQIFIDSTSTEMSSDEVYKLFTSMKDMFGARTAKDEMFVYGMIGEIITIKYFWENYNLNLTSFYRADSRSRYDLNFGPMLKSEIKATTKSNRIHTIKHEQLFPRNKTVFLISHKLLRDESGVCLEELFDDISNLFNNDYSKKMRVVKDIEMCGLLAKEIKMDIDFSFNELKVYSNKFSNSISVEFPKYITDIKYSMDFDAIEDCTIKYFVEKIKGLEI